VCCLACTLATTHTPLNKAQKKIMTKSASYISSAALSATVLTGPPLPPPGDAARTSAGQQGSGGRRAYYDGQTQGHEGNAERDEGRLLEDQRLVAHLGQIE
jgi:hypothetical protein